MTTLTLSRQLWLPSSRPCLIILTAGAAIDRTWATSVTRSSGRQMQRSQAQGQLISLPYYRPYATYADLCKEFGLPNVSTKILPDQSGDRGGDFVPVRDGRMHRTQARSEPTPASQFPCREVADYLGR